MNNDRSTEPAQTRQKHKTRNNNQYTIIPWLIIKILTMIYLKILCWFCKNCVRGINKLYNIMDYWTSFDKEKIEPNTETNVEYDATDSHVNPSIVIFNCALLLCFFCCFFIVYYFMFYSQYLSASK